MKAGKKRWSPREPHPGKARLRRSRGQAEYPASVPEHQQRFDRARDTFRRTFCWCFPLALAFFVLGIAGRSLAGENPPPTATEPPVAVTTAVEPRRVTIGTPFRYTMRVEARGEVELMVPILAERLGEFVILDFGEVPHDPATEGAAVIERWYTMVTYEAGDKLIPGAPIQYREAGTELQRLDAPETLVIVDSLLPKNEEALAKAALRDIKDPVEVPRNYTPFWWFGAALAALIGLAVGLYRFLNRSRRAREVPPRPAHEVAIEALMRLRSARLLERGQHERYYVQLSGILREYVEARFGIRAPEMTTEEFLQTAQRNRQLPAEHRPALSQFLAEADLVKFARHVPAPDDAERAYQAARRFVESTAARPEVPRAAA